MFVGDGGRVMRQTPSLLPPPLLLPHAVDVICRQPAWSVYKNDRAPVVAPHSFWVAPGTLCARVTSYTPIGNSSCCYYCFLRVSYGIGRRVRFFSPFVANRKNYRSYFIVTARSARSSAVVGLPRDPFWRFEVFD